MLLEPPSNKSPITLALCVNPSDGPFISLRAPFRPSRMMVTKFREFIGFLYVAMPYSLRESGSRIINRGKFEVYTGGKSAAVRKPFDLIQGQIELKLIDDIEIVNFDERVVCGNKPYCLAIIIAHSPRVARNDVAKFCSVAAVGSRFLFEVGIPSFLNALSAAAKPIVHCAKIIHWPVKILNLPRQVFGSPCYSILNARPPRGIGGDADATAEKRGNQSRYESLHAIAT